MARRDRRPLHSGKPIPKKPVLPTGKAPGERDSKVERVRAAVAAEDWRTALRLAKELSGLGEDDVLLSRAWEGLVRPDFLRQVNKDPEKAYEDGIAVLRRRFA
jgi:hypothetical protein